MNKQKSPFHSFLVGFYKVFSGCLILLVGGFIILLLAFMADAVEIGKVKTTILAISALVILGVFWRKRKQLSNKATNFSIFQRIVFDTLKLVLVLIIFVVTTAYLMKQAGYVPDQRKNNSDNEYVIEEEKDPVSDQTYFSNKLSWRDLGYSRHKINFKVAREDVLASKNNRTSYPLTYNFKWGGFYKYLADHDRPLLEELTKTFTDYQKEKKLSRRAFAELIITAVQSIPYHYIKEKPCDNTESEPCVGHVKYGLYAPAEFVSNFKGDCDTRTVLIFTLLSRFNYKVAILNSTEYRHSVLGLNIPSRGKFKKLKGKKYYFVETTSKRHPIGYLHTDYSNMNFWNFVLVN